MSLFALISISIKQNLIMKKIIIEKHSIKKKFINVNVD